MSLKNEISKLIKQQFNTKYYDNYLAYTIHKWAASEISDSIALCAVGCGNCKIKYKKIADSFDMKEEMEQCNILGMEKK